MKPFQIAALLALALSGCTRLAVRSAADIAEAAAPAFESYFDYDIAFAALPGNILQLEGLLRVDPTNERMVANAARLYCAYAYGFVLDLAEDATLRGEHEEAARQDHRAARLFSRGKALALHRLAQDHDGFETAYLDGFDAFAQHLEEDYTSESDAEQLFWVAYAWGGLISASRDDMIAVADLPFAIATMQRAVELRPSYLNGAGIAFLAAVASENPSAAEGEALALWTQALAVSERKSLLFQFNMARGFAVAQRDEALFRSLLQEVLDAGDVDPAQRLSNLIAKRRARRLLAHGDRLFEN